MENKFSRIIQGCMTWGKWGKQLSENEMVKLLHHSLEQGLTSFDHADIYGDYTTEADFGAAFAKSGVAREDIQLISKCGIQYVGETRDNVIKHYQYDADYIVWSTEKSIADLQCDYLDLFLLHRPSPLMQPDEVAKAVEKLLGSGKIKAFGVSNFTPSQMSLINTKSALRYNQIEFSLTAHTAMHDGTLDHLYTHGITPMCWSPLGTYFREANEAQGRIKTVMAELCPKYNATEDQLLLAWILKHPAGVHPVIGTTNPKRIELAAAAIDLPLTEIDWFKLLVAAQGHKVP